MVTHPSQTITYVAAIGTRYSLVVIIHLLTSISIAAKKKRNGSAEVTNEVKVKGKVVLVL
jgi:hypothetical protein